MAASFYRRKKKQWRKAGLQVISWKVGKVGEKREEKEMGGGCVSGTSGNAPQDSLMLLAAFSGVYLNQRVLLL